MYQKCTATAKLKIDKLHQSKGKIKNITYTNYIKARAKFKNRTYTNYIIDRAGNFINGTAAAL